MEKTKARMAPAISPNTMALIDWMGRLLRTTSAAMMIPAKISPMIIPRRGCWSPRSSETWYPTLPLTSRKSARRKTSGMVIHLLSGFCETVCMVQDETTGILSYSVRVCSRGATAGRVFFPALEDDDEGDDEGDGGDERGAELHPGQRTPESEAANAGGFDGCGVVVCEAEAEVCVAVGERIKAFEFSDEGAAVAEVDGAPGFAEGRGGGTEEGEGGHEDGEHGGGHGAPGQP